MYILSLFNYTQTLRYFLNRNRFNLFSKLQNKNLENGACKILFYLNINSTYASFDFCRGLFLLVTTY
jgi:hypothetical protein